MQYKEKMFLNLKMMADRPSTNEFQDAVMKAVDAVFEYLDKPLSDEKDVAEFFLKIARLVNFETVKKEDLFRKEDDSNHLYAKKEDLPFLWKWFIKQMSRYFKEDGISPITLAAFAEYYIDFLAHFFVGNNRTVSILISSFILLRNDCDLPEYRGDSEYTEAGKTNEPVSWNKPIDENRFQMFLAYYRTLCGKRKSSLQVIRDIHENKTVLSLKGSLDENNCEYFRETVSKSYKENPDIVIEINAKYLELISKEGIDLLEEYQKRGMALLFNELNQDCYVGLLLSGLNSYIGTHQSIPEIDVSDYPVLGQGANGIIYQKNEEVVVKTFKKNPDFSDILKERTPSLMALKLGINCPISFGYAMVDGKISLELEMMKGTSFLKLVKKDRSNIKRYMKQYVGLIKKMHSLKDETIFEFSRNTFWNEILAKAKRLQTFMDDQHGEKLIGILHSMEGNEVLIHGDIQPCNIRISENESGFIDLETMSTGPLVADLGSLNRTLFYDIEFYNSDENSFLGLSKDVVEEIWEEFISLYFLDESQKTKEKYLKEAKMISYVLSVAKLMKKEEDDSIRNNAIKKMESAIDEWD